MEKTNNFYQSIENKFDFLSKKMSILQDLVLRMKTEIDLLSKGKTEKEGFAQITSLTEKNLNNFLNKRPHSCKALDQCTTLIERSAFKVLNTYVNKGPNNAIKLLKKYKDLTDNYYQTGYCSDNQCLVNASNVFGDLLKIMESSDHYTLEKTKNLFKKIKDINLAEGKEKQECELLIPLSNEFRIKLLKILGKRDTYYSQLERELGKKGGPFKFHLKKLIDAGYVKKNNESGLYQITTKGLKVLNFLNELRQDILEY
ncbi:MAG: ArsR family transcriptional regulator [Promethearchaeota archaeon]|nr:MAG: ArsR family transcriptional regulator [Candidatus Lokiarchaeota archaeon]